jgi:hypothetical protein
VRESNKPPADNLRANREFATARRPPRRPRDPGDRAARALFEVRGRTPLHVRVAAFDGFDGLAWHEAPAGPRTRWIEREPGGCWMGVRGGSPTAIFAVPDTHQFKITAPLGSLVPAPPHLTRFRVGRVDQEGFFAWGPDGILRLAHRKTPPGIVVETECRTVDPRSLVGVAFPTGLCCDWSRYGGVPETVDPGVRALAHRWAGVGGRGWPRIEAVVRHLRAEYALDPSAALPDGCRDPLGHFLLRARRGPDYQFAGAAAVLLRVLGYPTRLVSGF